MNKLTLNMPKGVAFDEKLIKRKNNILTDMLEGIALTNDNIEIISETVVVKNKNSGVAWYQAVEVVMNQHMRAM